MTTLEKEALEALKQIYDIAKVRWRPLPKDSHEKKALSRAQAVLSNL